LVKPPRTEALMVHTIDFIKSFTRDAYVFGGIAAVHAMSDVHAMGGRVSTALAVVTVPYGPENVVEDTLVDLMTGAVDALEEDGCVLVGGHTCEGAEIALGFAVAGTVETGMVLTKGGMCPGDMLVLTKPVGTGVLLAGDMCGLVPGDAVAAVLRSMRQSNRRGGQLLARLGAATACTDVTGFGLVGHMREMCSASGMSCTLLLHAVPLLPGAQDCVDLGISSTLLHANLRLRRAVSNHSEASKQPAYPLLFDPQTSGGLLASVPKQVAENVVTSLMASGYTSAAVIGYVNQELVGNDKDGVIQVDFSS